MSELSGPPFRADQVGSLLRPPELLRARAEHQAGRLSAEDLHGIEVRGLHPVLSDELLQERSDLRVRGQLQRRYVQIGRGARGELGSPRT